MRNKTPATTLMMACTAQSWWRTHGEPPTQCSFQDISFIILGIYLYNKYLNLNETPRIRVINVKQNSPTLEIIMSILRVILDH